MKYKYYRYESINEVITGTCLQGKLSETEKMIVDNIIKHLGCYSGKILERFTHSETPWLKTRGNLFPNENTNKIIDKDLIAEYFIEVVKKYNMVNPSDIGEYSRRMFCYLN